MKVLAWNVGQTKYTPFLQYELSSNLESLMREPNSPDILVLIESNALTLQAIRQASPEKYGYLKGTAVPYSKSYPWSYFIVLWKNKDLTFHGNEQFPLKAEFDVKALSSEELKYSQELHSFVKSHLPNLEATSVNRFKFKLKGAPFSLYPVHFSNVWPAMQQYFYSSARRGAKHWMLPNFVEDKNASVATKAFVLKELIRGRLNPHAAFVDQYIRKLNELHPPEKSDETVLVVGDFNAFPRVEKLYGMGVRGIFETDKARACVEFEKHFRPAYAPAKSVSFPSDSYIEATPGTDYRLLIDLAYYRGSFWKEAQATVLPLEGSDHYPVSYEFFHEAFQQQEAQ